MRMERLPTPCELDKQNNFEHTTLTTPYHHDSSIPPIIGSAPPRYHKPRYHNPPPALHITKYLHHQSLTVFSKNPQRKPPLPSHTDSRWLLATVAEKTAVLMSALRCPISMGDGRNAQRKTTAEHIFYDLRRAEYSVGPFSEPMSPLCLLTSQYCIDRPLSNSGTLDSS